MKNKILCDHRGIRLEAIHFRGLTNMNTKDVFSYFQEFGPRGVEWIDDMWLSQLYTYLDQSIIYLLPGLVHFMSGVTNIETYV
jgi:hypothetical protein